MKNFYEQLDKVCKEHKTTIYAVEKATGSSKGSFIKWKTSSPSTDKLIEIADLLNVSMDYLLGREKSVQESNLPIQRPNALPFTDDELKIIMENKEGTKYFDQIVAKLDTQQKIYVLSWLIGYAQNQGISVEF